jgi:hypothetical protein
MKIKKVFKLFGRKITEGTEYMWKCYGDNVWWYTFENGENTVGVVFNPDTGKVYEMDFFSQYQPALEDTDIERDVICRWVDPKYEVAHRAECTARGIGYNKYQCYSLTSFLEMAQAAYRGDVPDFELVNDVELDLDPETYSMIMEAATKKNMSFDEFVNYAFRCELDKLENLKKE